MEDDLLSPENVVLLYVFWSSIDYSDYYINDLTDSNPKIYYINLAILAVSFQDIQQIKTRDRQRIKKIIFYSLINLTRIIIKYFVSSTSVENNSLSIVIDANSSIFCDK
ncbi:hypothetical protein RI543_004307 [Arxiozyma heterogenica]|uniref:Uncharacterized protein n=1 Tax=Arxiozyma heterogenica TaxID=278026 RepID=A0AAN7ZXB4_9SACH|nr:hypothetical protein RI543_004307 [Kazachstania heterogenica]